MTAIAPETTAEDLLSFVAPLPGLGGGREFTLSVLDEAGVLFAMRSVADPDLRLFLVRPEPFFADYAPKIDDSVLTELGALPDEIVVLVVVTPGAEGTGPTANLLAPIVAHRTSGTAVQAVLDGSAWPLRAPLAGA